MAAIDALLKAALRTFIDLHGAQFGNVQIIDTQNKRKVLLIRAQIGFTGEFLQRFGRVTADDDCACGRALRLGHSVAIPDTEEDHAFAPYREASRAAGFRAVISTPIQARGFEALGCISAHFADPYVPSELMLGRGEVFATNLARRVAAILEPEGRRSPAIRKG